MRPTGAPATRPGAYGLRIEGLLATELLTQVDPGSPVLSVSFESGRTTDRQESFREQGAEISLLEGGWVSLSRGGHAHFTLPRQIPDEELVHPWLVPAAATFNGWHGRQVLHGGAVAKGGRGVLVLGNKQDGKSSLLAALAQRDGIEVLADDLAVIDRGRVVAGPRCIDLRPDAEVGLGCPGSSRLVRDAGRLRMALKPCQPDARLTAAVVLGWSQTQQVFMRQMSQTEGFSALLPHSLNTGQGANLLELLGLPVWSLVRPRSWGSMEESAGQILALLDGVQWRPVAGRGSRSVSSGSSRSVASF